MDELSLEPVQDLGSIELSDELGSISMAEEEYTLVQDGHYQI
jgi:hypothetical protein